jgi:hypothetical protein
MQILVSLDEQLLAKYDKRGAPLFFGITWEHEGIYYPERSWMDFGVVILGWWFAATLRLRQGTDEDKFLFMDGPYAIKAKYYRQEDTLELIPEGLDTIWKVPFNELAKELIRTANGVYRELKRFGIGENDQINLNKYIALLRE